MTSRRTCNESLIRAVASIAFSFLYRHECETLETCLCTLVEGCFACLILQVHISALLYQHQPETLVPSPRTLHESCAAIRILRVDSGSFVNQHDGETVETPPCSHHERRRHHSIDYIHSFACRRAPVDVSPRLYKQRSHFLASPPSSTSQRGVPPLIPLLQTSFEPMLPQLPHRLVIRHLPHVLHPLPLPRNQRDFAWLFGLEDLPGRAPGCDCKGSTARGTRSGGKGLRTRTERAGELVDFGCSGCD
mmetsp:Transcript_45800/g.110243  ORF Transcript_45800/g.110243 Transcript_45800/m.110243 type:complete len:248 (-) Transcript_45800:165-908(-)